MRHLVLIALIFLATLTCGIAANSVQAKPPTYLMLRAPSRTHKGHAYYPGRGLEVKTHTYTYGWFGAKPRAHWTRSTGYYSKYIQWSKQ